MVALQCKLKLNQMSKGSTQQALGRQHNLLLLRMALRRAAEHPPTHHNPPIRPNPQQRRKQQSPPSSPSPRRPHHRPQPEQRPRTYTPAHGASLIATPPPRPSPHPKPLPSLQPLPSMRSSPTPSTPRPRAPRRCPSHGARPLGSPTHLPRAATRLSPARARLLCADTHRSDRSHR